jgi:hypothetical protein
MNDSSTFFLITILVLIVLFFLLRELNCWYWKINKRIDLLERQNFLIEKIFNHLTGGTTIESPEELKKISDKVKDNIISKLSDEERREYDKFINFGLQPGEKLVIHKKKRNIDRFTKEEWNGILYKNQENDWQILYEK